MKQLRHSKTPAIVMIAGVFGASGRIRTDYLRITNALLYRVSYRSIEHLSLRTFFSITYAKDRVNHFYVQAYKSYKQSGQAFSARSVNFFIPLQFPWETALPAPLCRLQTTDPVHAFYKDTRQPVGWCIRCIFH